MIHRLAFAARHIFAKHIHVLTHRLEKTYFLQIWSSPDWLGVVRRCGFSHHLRSLPRGTRGWFGWPPLHDLMQGVVRPSHVVRDGIF